MKIGIIGLGMVGTAVRSAHQFDTIVLIDNDPHKNCPGTYEQLRDCDGVFVCVPSPSGTDGKCDTRILEEVLAKLEELDCVIISKVTAPPDVYLRLNQRYKNLVYVPEFLTAANAVRDYIDCTFAIIGGSVSAYKHEAERVIREGQTQLINVRYCTIAEASLAKYTVNSFLASKVVFMNEISGLADAAGIDYIEVAQLVALDRRIGTSHMQVPGLNGEAGFGGFCFPKDTAALLNYATGQDADLSVLEAVVKKNTFLRLTNN